MGRVIYWKMNRWNIGEHIDEGRCCWLTLDGHGWLSSEGEQTRDGTLVLIKRYSLLNSFKHG